MDTIVIVGASLAGVHAAEGLRERGFTGSIAVVDREVGPVHDRPPLSKGALGGEVSLADCVLRSDSWARDLDVSYVGGRAAVSLNTGARAIALDDGSTLHFDGLLIATGLRPRIAPWLPTETPGLHTIRTGRDSENLREQLGAAASVAVIGGGFLGLEVASTARSMGTEVTVVEYESSLLSRVLPPSLGEWFANVHRRNGVHVRTGVAVTDMTSGPSGLTLRLSDQSTVVADLVVAALGAEPVTDWLAGSGVEVDDGVLCNADLSTSVAGVVAAGDVARWPNPVTGKSVRLEHWTNAVEQGRHAAGTLLGESKPFEAVPYFWTDQFDARARVVGWVSPAHEVHLKFATEESLVAAFGDRGELQGALCINAPKELVHIRRLIDQGTPWSQIVDAGDSQSEFPRSNVSNA